MSNGNLAVAMQPEEQEQGIVKSCQSMLEIVSNVKIVDQPTFNVAGEMLKDLAVKEKEIKAYWKEPKAKAAAAHKEICNRENDMLSIVQSALKLLRGKVSQYLTAQELKRQEEERKARIAAEEAARKEREKLEAQAEKLLDKGKVEKAEEKLEQAEQVFAAPVVIEKETEQTTRLENGGTISQKKDIEVTLPESAEDIKALCVAVAEGKVPVTCVSFSKAVLKSWAKQNLVKGKVHGCFFKETVSAMVR